MLADEAVQDGVVRTPRDVAARVDDGHARNFANRVPAPAPRKPETLRPSVRRSAGGRLRRRRAAAGHAGAHVEAAERAHAAGMKLTWLIVR